jgi:hypothetical protein
VALYELLVGRSTWSPGPICGLVIKLVTHSKFPMADPYSSRGRPTGPEGSLPSVEEYHEANVHQDSNLGQNALGANALGYWLLVCPFLAIPDSKCPGAAVTHGGTAFEPLDHKWAIGAYIALYPALTYRGL